MSLRLLRACLCLVLFGCTTTPSAPERAPASAEVPACTPGELLFAPSYLPLDLVPTPDGRSLLVVDRGFLALRDVSTLKVQRYLLPQVDGWTSASLSPDGRTVTAQTFDGQRYAFDTSTWNAERLQDARVLKHDLEQADFALMVASSVKSLGDEAFPQLVEMLREPALIRELTQKEIYPYALALDAARQQLLIGETTGGLTLLELAGQRILKRVPCEKNCSPYVSLSADAEGFLGVTAEGMLRVLDRELKVVREVTFLPPEQSQKDEPRQRLVRRVVRVGDGSRIAWLTRDHEMGLFELGTGTHVLRLPALGLGGTAMAALLDARRLALLSEGTLRIWDMPEQRVLVEKQGPYASAIRLDAERLLATREDGSAEVISSSSGELLRRFCATQRTCERDPKEMQRLLERAEQAEGEESAALFTELGALQSPQWVMLLVSPDRQTLVTLAYPMRVERSGPAAPGSIGTWRLPGLEPLGMRSFTREDMDGKVRFGADGVLYTGREPLSAAGLPAPAADKESDSGRTYLREDDVSVYSGGGLTIHVEPSSRDENYDTVALLGPGERPLGVLSYSDVHARRWPLRRETFADVLPSGERFLIASRAAQMEGTSFGPFLLPSGPAQVWCSPRESPLPPFPEAPPLPSVMEADGLTEVSLAGVPIRYEAIAAREDGSVYLMAKGRPAQYSSPSGPSTLWRLTPLSPEAERLEPPPASNEWSRLATAPDDGALWALGKGVLAHREADGRWTVHTLPGAEGQLRGFLALPGGRAVVMRSFHENQQVRLQLIIAGPGPALQVTEHSGGGEPMPLVPLPDGFLFLGTRVSPYSMSGTPAPVLVPGFRFRDGKRLEKDALLAQVRDLLPQKVWLRQGRVLMISDRRPANLESLAWVEVDARTGKVLKQQEPPAQPRTIVGVPDVQANSEGEPRTKLPEWLDHRGKVIEMPSRYTPIWLRNGNELQETAITSKGTWLQMEGNVLLFWDGTRLSAYFHPDTRQHGLRYAD